MVRTTMGVPFPDAATAVVDLREARRRSTDVVVMGVEMEAERLPSDCHERKAQTRCRPPITTRRCTCDDDTPVGSPRSGYGDEQVKSPAVRCARLGSLVALRTAYDEVRNA